MSDSLATYLIQPTRCDNCARVPGEGETIAFYQTFSSEAGQEEKLCAPCDEHFRARAADLRRRLIKIGAIVPGALAPRPPAAEPPPWWIDRPTFRILPPAA